MTIEQDMIIYLLELEAGSQPITDALNDLREGLDVHITYNNHAKLAAAAARLEGLRQAIATIADIYRRHPRPAEYYDKNLPAFLRRQAE